MRTATLYIAYETWRVMRTVNQDVTGRFPLGRPRSRVSLDISTVLGVTTSLPQEQDSLVEEFDNEVTPVSGR